MLSGSGKEHVPVITYKNFISLTGSTRKYKQIQHVIQVKLIYMIQNIVILLKTENSSLRGKIGNSTFTR